MTLYDISQTIRPGIPVWPGDSPYSLLRTWKIEPGCPVNVSKMTLSTHTGTHADSPLHFDAEGADSATSVLEPYIGPAILLDLSDRVPNGELVFPEHLESLPSKAERVLLKLFKRFPHDGWNEDFPAVSPAAIELLAERGCKLIGLDVPSLDPQNSKTLDAHHAVGRAHMAILEGLVLDDIPPGDYELIALPLKVANADGTPVRAILREMR